MMYATATAGAQSGPTRFSTVDLPHPSRVALWEEHNARALIALGCRTLSNASLEATELNLHLPRLQFAHISGNPHVIERNQRFISSRPADAVVLYFNLEADAFFYHQEGCEILHPGQAVLYDADQPFMRGFSQGLEELALKVPRALYKEISGQSGLIRPQIFDFNMSASRDQHARALAGLITGALAGPDSDREGLEASAIDLLRIMVNGYGDAGGRGHFITATSFIRQRLSDPHLSASQIAAAVAISERQLTRVFAKEGVSVSRFIRKERLELARQILSHSDGGKRSLAQVAAQTGFVSYSHFSRAYKERFGVGPLRDSHATDR